MRHPQTRSRNQRADRQYREQPRHPDRNRRGSLIPGVRSGGWRDQTTLLAQEAQRLWQDLPMLRVVFSPIGEWDMAPLQRLSHLADVYILCDWRFDPDMFDHMVGGLVAEDRTHNGLEPYSRDGERPVIAVPTEQVQAISGRSEDFGLFNEPAWLPGKQPWCRIVRLTRRIGGLQRPVWLVYIVGNCVEIYQRLFLERGSVPAVLWLQCPLGVDPVRWAKFVSPGGEVGRVFCKARRQPSYVAARRPQPGWQQRVLYQRLLAWNPAWDLTLYALPDAPPERSVGVRRSGGRKVIVDRTPIHPAKLGKDELVILTLEEYRRHRWPEDQVVLNTHRLAGEQAGRGRKRRLETSLLRGKPMNKALQMLEAYCGERGYRRVALTRCGYEDEGPVLGEWQAGAGRVEQITFHCETDGDLLSVGPWALESGAGS